MTDDKNRLDLPWTHEQVDALNRFQRAGFMHEFTCANSHPGLDRTLVATIRGWICPHCDYTQAWAHRFMLIVPVNPLENGNGQKSV